MDATKTTTGAETMTTETMTFEQFQASGHDIEDLGLVTDEDFLTGVNGRIYHNGLWTVPCVTSGVGWMTIIGNREHQSRHLRSIERVLYKFAVDAGYIS